MPTSSEVTTDTNPIVHLDTAWNKFWFTSNDPCILSVLRILSGVIALYFLLSYNQDLVHWFGPDGLLPTETVRQITGAASTAPSANRPVAFHISHLDYITSVNTLWISHVLAILVVMAFTVGLLTRLTSVLSFLILLAYVHRAPMIAGLMEPVLVMLVMYLCLGPAGAFLSVDAWRKSRASQGKKGDSERQAQNTQESIAANIARRLIQIHLAGLYLIMGLSKLGGDTWWVGQAVWWLIAHTESRLVDLTFLYRYEYLLNAWTHGVVLFELGFAILIWNRNLRPFLLWLGVVHWVAIALITGLMAFSAVMLVANLAFLEPRWLRRSLMNYLSRWRLLRAPVLRPDGA